MYFFFAVRQDSPSQPLLTPERHPHVVWPVVHGQVGQRQVAALFLHAAEVSLGTTQPDPVHERVSRRQQHFLAARELGYGRRAGVSAGHLQTRHPAAAAVVSPPLAARVNSRLGLGAPQLAVLPGKREQTRREETRQIHDVMGGHVMKFNGADLF